MNSFFTAYKPACFAIVALIALTSGATARAGTLTVTDGGFESGLSGWSVSPTVQGDIINAVSNAAAGNNPNWWNANPGASSNGGNFYWQDGGASYSGILSQTLTGLTAGASYTVSFQQAATSYQFNQGATGGTNTLQWQVGLGGAIANTTTGYTLSGASIQDSTLMTVNDSHHNVGWQTQSLTFTANAGSEMLSFLALGTGNPPVAFLDGISVVQTSAVPEPANILLLGSGLLLLLAVRRHRAV